jgi:lysophospholipase L1-like esterase
MHRMRLAVAVSASALAVAATAATPAFASTPHAASSTNYYLSLGDSLSQGVQPNSSGQSVPTDQGFTDQLHAMLNQLDPTLGLKKLGCPGETTTTLVKGGICGYKGDSLYSWTADKGSQLAAALTFLKEHAGHVPLITVVIGANDVLPCAGSSAIQTCLSKVLPVVQKNLTTTLTQLRAADPTGRIIGMTYYDPLLAGWLTPAEQTLAKESITFASIFRTSLTGVYKALHASVADVYTAFRTTDMTDKITLPNGDKVPEAVGLICERTWMCAPLPQGPNIHANATGYKIIAATFLSALFWQR